MSRAQYPMSENAVQRLVREGYHALIICEGTAEEVVIKKLIDADALIFPQEDVIEVTRTRKASEIQANYLSYDFPWPVCIMRVLDSRKESFQLGSLYVNRYPVINVFTHPEMEALVIVREGMWQQWSKVKSSVRPSVYCKQELGMKKIKRAAFLEAYWDVGSIVAAVRDYRRLSKIPAGELCLADVIKEDLIAS